MRTILKYAVVCLTLTLAADSFAQTCQNWVNDVEYDEGATIIYEGDGYIANRDVYQNTPPRPEDNEWFWSPTDVCNGAPPQQDCWEFDGDDITNTNDGNVYIGDENSGNYIEFSVNPNTGGKLVSRDSRGGRADFSTLGLSIGSNTIDFVKFSSEGLHVDRIQSVAAHNPPIIFESDVTLDSDCKLTAGEVRVNGDLFARQVTVTLDAFPDYVFSPMYKLKSLSEIEEYIQNHGTLPGMPSEKEVKKNGVDLGEMNAKLLEKIEEMTLHMIKMQKRIDELEAEINNK